MTPSPMRYSVSTEQSADRNHDPAAFLDLLPQRLVMHRGRLRHSRRLAGACACRLATSEEQSGDEQ